MSNKPMAFLTENWRRSAVVSVLGTALYEVLRRCTGDTPTNEERMAVAFIYGFASAAEDHFSARRAGSESSPERSPK